MGGGRNPNVILVPSVLEVDPDLDRIVDLIRILVVRSRQKQRKNTLVVVDPGPPLAVASAVAMVDPKPKIKNENPRTAGVLVVVSPDLLDRYPVPVVDPVDQIPNETK